MRRVAYLAPLVVVAALAVEAGWSAEPGAFRAQSMTQIAGESFNARSMELPDELLRGAIDIHVHAGPHLKSSPRRVDPLQAAQQAKAAGMRGLVYMDVMENSSGTAWLVSRAVPDIQVFGGIILNTVYGGMNPRAVHTALYYGAGAKFVSFGAHSTYYLASQEGRMVDGKPVLFKDLYPKFAAQELARAIRIPLEDPVPADLDEILQLVAEHPDVYLNTGHVSAAGGAAIDRIGASLWHPHEPGASGARRPQCDDDGPTEAGRRRRRVVGSDLRGLWRLSGRGSSHALLSRERVHQRTADLDAWRTRESGRSWAADP